MSQQGLWDQLSRLYGTSSAPSPTQTTLAIGYTPAQAATPQQQAPTSALGSLNPTPPTPAAPSSGGGSASPNYVGLARQGLSAANTLTGGGSGSALGDAGAGLGVFQGISSGTPVGYAGAAVNAGKLANNLGAFGSNSSNAGTGLGAAGSALGIYGGLQQGGVAGDTQAGLSAAQGAAQIAGAAGATGLSTALAAAGPISLALAPVLFGASRPAVQLGQKYWGGVQNSLQSAINSGDRGQIAAQVNGLLSQPQKDIPTQIQQLVYSTGFVPDQGWGTSYVPGQSKIADQIVQQAGGDKGSSGKTRSANRAARGGSMKNDSKARSARLQELYKSSFANRKRHFDDGGGVGYSNYGSYLSYGDYPGANYGDTIASQYTPPPVDYSNVTLPTDQAGLQQALQNNTPNTGYNADGSQFNVNESSNPIPTGLQEGSNPALQNPSSIPSLSSSALSSLGVSSMGQFLQKYGALAPILAAALGGNKAASAPATPAGYGSIPSIATPTNTRSYTQPNVANWYTYGEGPEQSFFSNNALPTVPGMSPGTGAAGATATPSATPAATPATSAATPTATPAASGAVPTISNSQPVLLQGGARMAGGGTFDSSQGDSYVADPGHGDGTSDAIDAKLSGGEYVMDGGTVSMLGNGSNEAGARALDQLRQRVRKHAGKQLVRGKQFMKAKAPEAYLRGGSK